jgi:hypothetical protein
MKSYYSLAACNELISRYVDKEGEIITLDEGCLGLGTIVCLAEGCKTAVIQEIYLNEWSSAHTIRLYSKTPKKYLQLIGNL